MERKKKRELTPEQRKRRNKYNREWKRRKKAELRQQILDHYENKCRVPGCQTGQKLEYAHIKATGLNGRGRGSWERIRDVIQNWDCYVLLCVAHHTDYDSGLIDLDGNYLDGYKPETVDF